MKMTIFIIISALLLCLIVYYFLFPRNTFFTFYLGDKRRIVFSRTSVSYKPSPDRFPNDGLNHIAPYISKLLVTSTKFKSLLIFTPDGQRGLSLDAKEGQIKVRFTIDWRKDPAKEKTIRKYFQNLDIKPTEDYLGGNGGVPDAVRILSYPITGTEPEVVNLVKDMLQNLSDVSSNEVLDINYEAG